MGFGGGEVVRLRDLESSGGGVVGGCQNLVVVFWIWELVVVM